MKPLRRLLLLTIIALALLSAKSYGQDTQSGASSLPKSEPVAGAPVTFDDAAKIILDRLDAAEEYIKQLESSGAAADDRLELEKQRTAILSALAAAKDAEINALKREIEAGKKIDAEQAKIIQVQAERITKLEKKKGGGFLKGFGVGFVAGFLGKALL